VLLPHCVVCEGEHPKAKLMKHMDLGVLAEDDPADGRNSSTSVRDKAMRRLEAHRQAGLRCC